MIMYEGVEATPACTLKWPSTPTGSWTGSTYWTPCHSTPSTKCLWSLRTKRCETVQKSSVRSLRLTARVEAHKTCNIGWDLFHD